MKKNILFICLSIILFSCQKDDLSWKNEILNIKNQLYVQQQLINALQDGITIKSITPSDNGYSISFSNGTSISLSDGKTPIISIGKDGFWYINEINTNTI